MKRLLACTFWRLCLALAITVWFVTPEILKGRQYWNHVVVSKQMPPNTHSLQGKNSTTSTLPRIIWLLWFQGWDNAPEMIVRISKTWSFHNPGWKIVKLDGQNLSEYVDSSFMEIPGIQYPAASDILRLRLLDTFGGVWADSTMVCMRPLDGWIDEAVQPAKFWMYHGRDHGRGPASWFIAALRNSSLIRTWREKADAFWLGRAAHDYEYFWMDRLFSNMLRQNSHLLHEWRKVPYKNCEDAGSAHAMAGHVYDSTPEVIALIQKDPPLAIKLSLPKSVEWQERVNDSSMNLFRVLEIAEKPRAPRREVWGERPLDDDATFF